MTKKRIIILVILLIFGVALGYFASNYLNGMAVREAATDHVTAPAVIFPNQVNPVLNWLVGSVTALSLLALVICGIFIGWKFDSEVY